MAGEGDKAAAAQQQQKGAETFLTGDERKNLQRMLGFPEDIPPKFKSWMQDYLSVNFPQIPITQISGFEKYLYKKGTELPENPRDGQTYAYVVDSTSGILWRFQYNADSGSQYKWEFIGGAPVALATTASVSTTGNAWVDLGGPGMTVPLAGEYLVQFGAEFTGDTLGADTTMGIGSSTADVDDDYILTEHNGYRTSQSKTAAVTVTSAQGTLKAFYRMWNADGRTGFWRRRWVSITPIRVKKA